MPAQARIDEHQRYLGYSLLLQIVLPGAASFAIGEWALMILFSSVHPGMPGKVTTGCEDPIASGTDVLLFRNWFLDDGDYLLWFHIRQTSDIGLRVWCCVGCIIVAIFVSVRVIFRGRFTRHTEGNDENMIAMIAVKSSGRLWR